MDSREDAEGFVHRFAEVWADPAPDRLRALLHTDATLRQPLLPSVESAERGERMFGRLLTLVPDLTGEVVRSAAAGDTVFIELALSGTYGGRPIGWTTVDQVTLRDGLLAARTAHFDSLPLLRTLLTRPRGWPTLARLLLVR